MPTNPLWKETPLIYSDHLSARLGHSVYLKLEVSYLLHPSHSFKWRGLSHFIQQCDPRAHIIAASGGNAGLAVASAANLLHMKCTIFIPKRSAIPSIIAYFKRENAEVVVGGEVYLDALTAAQDAVAADKNAVLIPAYDHPIIWEGHGSMVPEIANQLGCKPDAIFCSVGGGGLLGGLIVGCDAIAWDDVPIIALETLGSNCFYSAVSLNSRWKNSKGIPEDISISQDEKHNVKIAHLKTLSSRATSLGASSASPGVVEKAMKRKGEVKCVCVSDAMSMSAAVRFAENHKMMVELACSTTLTPAYEPALMSHLIAGTKKTLVFIVCGGYKISLDEMEEYREVVREDLEGRKTWEGTYNGEQWCIDIEIT